ncbi:unnamed protein product [Nesidiocoris tenuis]|uniref:Uncharacterized protein n=2 Tax=Nesidiocoris tenuis TaxID=355587 RepID=A0ABN7AIB9_9HEMI|nr:Hypothetical protein NTJ_04611 [Nesidiocoris tenuis]CAB0017967.1 unnamed protein product [Nesidiocoris tenuis]
MVLLLEGGPRKRCDSDGGEPIGHRDSDQDKPLEILELRPKARLEDSLSSEPVANPRPPFPNLLLPRRRKRSCSTSAQSVPAALVLDLKIGSE